MHFVIIVAVFLITGFAFFLTIRRPFASLGPLEPVSSLPLDIPRENSIT